jgi:hypothetical protein
MDLYASGRCWGIFQSNSHDRGYSVMNANAVLKGIGIVLVCVGIHFGLGGLLPLIVFGSGLGFLFLA